MQAHGELVVKLQIQIESHQRNEKELHLVIAKLRSEKCQINAELSIVKAKARYFDETSLTTSQQHKLVRVTKSTRDVCVRSCK